MRRAGVRIVGRRGQTGHSRIHPGVEDQVTEDQQESLQGVNSCEISRFVNFHKSQIAKTPNTFIFSTIRVVSGVHYFRAKEFELKDDRTIRSSRKAGGASRDNALRRLVVENDGAFWQLMRSYRARAADFGCPSWRREMLRIQGRRNGEVVFTLSGRIDEENIAELEALIGAEEWSAHGPGPEGRNSGWTGRR